MARQNIIFCLDESFNVRNIMDIRDVENSVFRIFADRCREVKVIYDKRFGCYQTVVVTDNGELIYICL